MQFISKRNQVFLRDGLVDKQVKDPQSAALEALTLRELRERGVAVPEVISFGENLLILEHLPGEPLPDVIERGEYDPQCVAIALCDWFAAFYAAIASGECRGDVNGRNFLIDGCVSRFDGMKVYSVDFEERCHGSIARDAGRLAAFIETYETREKAGRAALSRVFMQYFSERFRCEMGEIMAERELELAAMRLRRNHGPQP